MGLRRAVKGRGREEAQAAAGTFGKRSSAGEGGCSSEGQQGEVVGAEGNAVNIPLELLGTVPWFCNQSAGLSRLVPEDQT